MASMREPATGWVIEVSARWSSAFLRYSQNSADPGEGLAGGHRVVGVGEPLGECARVVRGHVDVALSGGDVADHLAGAYLGTFGQVLGRREVTRRRGDHDAELQRRLQARRGTVAGD